MQYKKDEFFMKLAIEQAKKALSQGEVPVGAILVQNGQVLIASFNQKEVSFDATAHAEILAIRAGCQKLKKWRLTDAMLYVTLEPCVMCAGAIVEARIARLVYGVYDVKAGAVDSLFNIGQNKHLNHIVEVRGGVLEDECLELLQKFFKDKRKV